jgi:hypothetical protein
MLYMVYASQEVFGKWEEGSCNQGTCLIDDLFHS